MIETATIKVPRMKHMTAVIRRLDVLRKRTLRLVGHEVGDAENILQDAERQDAEVQLHEQRGGQREAAMTEMKRKIDVSTPATSATVCSRLIGSRSLGI